MEDKEKALTARLRSARWFWRALWVVALVAAVGYLRVTSLAPLGGDDQINNLQDYRQLLESSPWQMLYEQLRSIADALCLKESRFFPFSTVPVGLRCWFKRDIDRYRMLIIGHTLVDAALLGVLADRVTGNRRLGLACFALLPLMLCLWSDHAINGMYSYCALPQMAIFPALLAGLCMVALHRTKHLRWAVLGACMTFWTCGTYEIGYTYIFMLGILALMLEPRFWRAVRLGLPFLGGELAALFYYVMSDRLNSVGTGYAGINVSPVPGKILTTWFWQVSGAFPLNAPLLSLALPHSITPGDILCPLLLAGVCVACFVLGRPALNRRQSVCLFCMGGTMLVCPALLIALSVKYQNVGWVGKSSAYIPAAVQSFGVALLALVLLALLFRAARERSRRAHLAAAVTVLVCLTLCGTYQRSVTRTRYDNGERDTYEFLCDSVEAGLADDISEASPLVCEFNVWGSNKGAQEEFFLRYGGARRNAYHVDAWEKDPQPNGEDIYFLCYIRNYEGYDVAWLAHVTDDMTRYADSVKVYIQGAEVPEGATLSYVTQAQDGSEVWHEAAIDTLPRTEPDENGDYFVTVEDENIVSCRISLWP